MSNVYENHGSVGFSDKIYDSKITEAIRKSKRSGRGCAFIIVPLPLIIYTIVSYVSDEVMTTDAIIFGGGASIAFLLVYLFSCFISNAKRGWDGVVTDKWQKHKTRWVKDGDERELEHYEECVLIFCTDRGKKQRSVERFYRGQSMDTDYYQYFEVGDRVRYYPQLNYKYEKYDKSRDHNIPCMICKKFNDVHKDVCDSCGNPLFK